MIIIPDTGYSLGLRGSGKSFDVLPETAIFLNQVHGNRILLDPAGGESADGMIIRRGEGVPALRVADCLPVFAIWDDYVGAAHAGWRGLADGIVENLISAVDQPLRWFITGPCICGECYEVGGEVAEAVFLKDPAGEKGHSSGRIDLKGSALRRARNMSGDKFQVINIDECTMESANLYSYRNNRTAGRNVLWLAEIERGEHIRQLRKTELNVIPYDRRKN